MLQQTDCHVTLHYHRPGVLLLAPPPPLVIEFDSSPTTALSACWPHCVRLTPSTYWGLAPLEYWFFKNIRKTASSLKMLRVYSLLTTPYRLRLCGQTDDSACLLWCSPILPFLWSDTFFSILPPFPSLTDLLGTGDFLAHPLLWEGGSTFSQELLLLNSSSLRIHVIYGYISLNWVLSRLSSEILPSTASSPFGRHFWPKFDAVRHINIL